MNVPKLRFKEFNDEYETIKLEDVAELTSSKRIYLSDYTDSGIPFYRGKEISELKINKPVSDLLYISNEKYEEMKSKYGAPKENEILITGVGTLGNIYRIPNNEKFYFKDGNLIWLKSIKQNPEYLEYNLEFNRKKLLDSAIGSTQKALTIAGLNKLSFNYPSKLEQSKIAKTMQLIDKKINLQSKKIEDLKLFKMSTLNSFFNNNTNVRKELISKYCNLFTGKNKSNKINLNGNFFIMDMGSISSEGYILKNKLTSDNSDMLSIGDLVMPKDDIGGGFIIGKTGYIDEDNKYVLGDHVYLIKSKGINSLFLHYQINSRYINLQLKKKVTGSAQLGLKASNILNQQIYVYNEEEQAKIAKIFELLDSKIKLEIKKNNKLINLKKGLMQNMFV